MYDVLTKEPFWTILNNISVVIGFITLIISGVTLYNVKQESKRLHKIARSVNMAEYSEYKKRHEKIVTDNPKALCLSLIENTVSIKKTVEKFLQQDNKQMPVFEILRDKKLTPEDIESIIAEMKVLRRGDLADATELHLFIQAPVQIATLAGAIFDNWIPIILYQWDRENSIYRYWGPMSK